MKEKMLEFLMKEDLPIYFEEKELIREFIETFFSNYQPERLNPEARKGCDSLNSVETQREESEEVLPPGDGS